MPTTYVYRDDFFEPVWEQDGASGSMQPALSCLWSPRQFSGPPDVRFDPPSEDEMAAWLGAIVKGEEELACGDDDDGSRRTMTDDGRDVVPAAKGTSSTTAMELDKKEKIPTTTTEGIMMGNKVCAYVRVSIWKYQVTRLAIYTYFLIPRKKKLHAYCTSCSFQKVETTVRVCMCVVCRPMR